MVYFSKNKKKILATNGQKIGWKKGNLKKATEETIIAAHEQAIRRSPNKHHIDNGNVCYLCGEK